MHRAPAKGMADDLPSDPRAEKIRRRKARKQPLRVATRELGFVGVVKLELDARRLTRTVAVSEECEDCQRLNRKTA